VLAGLGIPETDLFRSREEILEDAYARRGQQIAHVKETGGPAGGDS